MAKPDLRRTSLILAIESDAGQASWVTTAVRRQSKAEFLLVRTVGEAIKTMAKRVPDVVLVPALLSPRDDAALMEAVRANADAAHVQVLTIPMLTPADESSSGGRGLLGRLRRDRTSMDAAGKQVAVFSDQIASSLERAMEQRGAAAGGSGESAAPDQGTPELASLSELEGKGRIVLERPNETVPSGSEFAAPSTSAPAPAPAHVPVPAHAPAPAPSVSPATPEPAHPSFTATAAQELEPVFDLRVKEWPAPPDSQPHVVEAAGPRRQKKTGKAAKRAPRPRIVHKGWEDLDPLQCGFPALLARLREVSTPAKPPGEQPAAKG